MEPKRKSSEITLAPATSTSTASASISTTSTHGPTTTNPTDHSINTSTLIATTTATNTSRDKTYTLYKKKLSWNEAKHQCENHNGRLACIHDAETQEKVVNVIKDGKPDGDIWIGLEAVSKRGPFRWTDGTEVSGNKNAGYYHNYRGNEPNEYQIADNIAVRIVLEGGEGKWADIGKLYRYWYVCES